MIISSVTTRLTMPATAAERLIEKNSGSTIIMSMPAPKPHTPCASPASRVITAKDIYSTIFASKK